MNFLDFLLALSESGFWGKVSFGIILVAIITFIINIISIPHRVNKIKNDVEIIKNILQKEINERNQNQIKMEE